MGKKQRRKRRARMRIAERTYATHPRYYLAYGSNHNIEQMGFRCPDAQALCRAFLRDWKLVFSGVLTIEPAEDRVTPLSVWKVTPLDIMSLDRYEGYPHLYSKMYLDVEVDGKKREGFTYILNKPYAVRPPMVYYYRDVYDGYRAWGFEDDELRAARNEAGQLPQWEYAYIECDVCGRWVPADEMVMTHEMSCVCWECALGDVTYEYEELMEESWNT